ncbi:MAG: class I SAM-dependent methyltransferase [Tepidisphaeraceae bacterium]|jgi:predicted O-methyltransferase YrrM
MYLETARFDYIEPSQRLLCKSADRRLYEIASHILHMLSGIPSTDHPGAIDAAHVTLLLGAIMSLKPERVLELGVGSGYATWAIIGALQHNGRGKLVCVDNWFDTEGKEPPFAADIRGAGAEIIVDSEEHFVRNCPTDSFDLLLSDADHFHSGSWLGEHLRIVRDGGFLFFHDTNNPQFPSVQSVVAQISRLPHYHFTKSSRPDERCQRGWLWVVNRK